MNKISRIITLAIVAIVLYIDGSKLNLTLRTGTNKNETTGLVKLEIEMSIERVAHNMMLKFYYVQLRTQKLTEFLFFFSGRKMQSTILYISILMLSLCLYYYKYYYYYSDGITKNLNDYDQSLNELNSPVIEKACCCVTRCDLRNSAILNIKHTVHYKCIHKKHTHIMHTELKHIICKNINNIIITMNIYILYLKKKVKISNIYYIAKRIIEIIRYLMKILTNNYIYLDTKQKIKHNHPTTETKITSKHLGLNSLSNNNQVNKNVNNSQNYDYSNDAFIIDTKERIRSKINKIIKNNNNIVNHLKSNLTNQVIDSTKNLNYIMLTKNINVLNSFDLNELYNSEAKLSEKNSTITNVDNIFIECLLNKIIHNQNFKINSRHLTKSQKQKLSKSLLKGTRGLSQLPKHIKMSRNHSDIPRRVEGTQVQENVMTPVGTSMKRKSSRTCKRPEKNQKLDTNEIFAFEGNEFASNEERDIFITKTTNATTRKEINSYQIKTRNESNKKVQCRRDSFDEAKIGKKVRENLAFETEVTRRTKIIQEENKQKNQLKQGPRLTTNFAALRKIVISQLRDEDNGVIQMTSY